jgi:SAM-dependent methyltransferase
VSTEPSEILQRDEGRRLFGRDARVYEAGRPQYPEAVYEFLEGRCGLANGSRVLEVGPGTGLVTRRLLEAGASVVAIEPDPGLAAYLRAAFMESPVEVLETPLESATLEDGAFDLAVAATSFHWVDQRVGLDKLRRALRPGASVALWWTLYRDPWATDEFTRAVEAMLGPNTRGAFDEPGRPPFQLDVEHRLRDMRGWGHLEDLEAKLVETKLVLRAKQARALYASMATVLRRRPEERAVILDFIESLVDGEFGGAVQRRFVTALYTGRRASEPADN